MERDKMTIKEFNNFYMKSVKLICKTILKEKDFILDVTITKFEEHDERFEIFISYPDKLLYLDVNNKRRYAELKLALTTLEENKYPKSTIKRFINLFNKIERLIKDNKDYFRKIICDYNLT